MFKFRCYIIQTPDEKHLSKYKPTIITHKQVSLHLIQGKRHNYSKIIMHKIHS